MHRYTALWTLVVLALLTVWTTPPAAAQDKTKAALPAAAAVAEKGKVNINTATAEQLATLKGVGPKIADSIIAFRKTNGPFKEIADLMKVDGIGPKAFEGVKDYITVK